MAQACRSARRQFTQIALVLCRSSEAPGKPDQIGDGVLGAAGGEALAHCTYLAGNLLQAYGAVMRCPGVGRQRLWNAPDRNAHGSTSGRRLYGQAVRSQIAAGLHNILVNLVDLASQILESLLDTQ